MYVRVMKDGETQEEKYNNQNYDWTQKDQKMMNMIQISPTNPKYCTKCTYLIKFEVQTHMKCTFTL